MPMGLGIFIQMNSVNGYSISEQYTVKLVGGEIQFNDIFTSVFQAPAACHPGMLFLG